MFRLKKCFGRYPFFLENGGILGLTKDDDKLCRWQICSLEAARAFSKFEDSTELKEK